MLRISRIALKKTLTDAARRVALLAANGTMVLLIAACYLPYKTAQDLEADLNPQWFSADQQFDLPFNWESCGQWFKRPELYMEFRDCEPRMARALGKVDASGLEWTIAEVPRAGLLFVPSAEAREIKEWHRIVQSECKGSLATQETFAGLVLNPVADEPVCYGGSIYAELLQVIEPDTALFSLRAFGRNAVAILSFPRPVRTQFIGRARLKFIGPLEYTTVAGVRRRVPHFRAVSPRE